MHCDNHTQHTMGHSLCPVAPPGPPPGPPPACALTKGTNFNGGDLMCGGQLCPQSAAVRAGLHQKWDRTCCLLTAFGRQQTPGACCELCGSKMFDATPTGNCSAWTWLHGKCYLKGAQGYNTKLQAGCTSGTVTSRGAPHATGGKSPMEPTNNDPMKRTMNRGAKVGSVNDTYQSPV
jgi:hypothetical protein